MTDGATADSVSAGLIDRLRAGDDTALGELFEAHEPVVRRLARGLATDTAEADDITAETFFRVLQAVRRGSGPRDNVRAYLMTVARRVAWEWQGSRRDVPVTDEELTSRAGGQNDPQAGTAEAALITRAFSTLPERWRTVLWQTEVEGAAPATLARHFGLSANATAALARRARIGLRAAYLQAHLTTDRETNGCRSVREKLGGYTAGCVTGAESRKVEQHLARCAPCRATHDELRQVCAALRAHAGVLVPLVPLFGFPAGAVLGAAGSVSGTGGGTSAVASVTSATAGGAAAGGAEAGATVALAVGANSKLGLTLASTAAAVTVVSAPVLDGIAGSGGSDDGAPSSEYALTRSTEEPGGAESDFVGSSWSGAVLARSPRDGRDGSGTRGGDDPTSATGVPSTPAAGPGPSEYTLPPPSSTAPGSGPGSPVDVPGADAPAGDLPGDVSGPPDGDGAPGAPDNLPTGDAGDGRGGAPEGTGPGRGGEGPSSGAVPGDHGPESPHGRGGGPGRHGSSADADLPTPDRAWSDAGSGPR